MTRWPLSSILWPFQPHSRLNIPIGDEQHKRPWNSGQILKNGKWGMIEGGIKRVLEKSRLCKVGGIDGMEQMRYTQKNRAGHADP